MARLAILLSIAACAADPAPPDPACEVVVATSVRTPFIVQILAGAECDGDRGTGDDYGWALLYNVYFTADADGPRTLGQRIDNPCGAVANLTVVAGVFELHNIEGVMWRGRHRIGETKCATRVEEQQ